MMEFLNNIFELARATWKLFCMAPVTCIILVVVGVIAIYLTYGFIKDVIWTDKGGPIILR